MEGVEGLLGAGQGGAGERRRPGGGGEGTGGGAVCLYVISDLLRFLRRLFPWLGPATEATVFEDFHANILTLTSIRERSKYWLSLTLRSGVSHAW